MINLQISFFFLSVENFALKLFVFLYVLKFLLKRIKQRLSIKNLLPGTFDKKYEILFKFINRAQNKSLQIKSLQIKLNQTIFPDIKFQKMHEEERLQEISSNRDSVQQLNKKEMIKAPATNKSQQLSPQKLVNQQVKTQRISIQQYNKELKAHFHVLVLTRQDDFVKYIRSLENIKLSEDQEKYKGGLEDYLKLIYNNIQGFEKVLSSQVVSKASKELVIIAKKLINYISSNLTQEQRQKYVRNVSFYSQIASKFGKIYELDLKFLTIDGLLQLDIMMLFFLKNKDYEQMFDIDYIIPQQHFLSVFDIQDHEYVKFKQRFQEKINILQPVHRQKCQDFMNLICVYQLRQRIHNNHRNKAKKPYKERSISNNFLSKPTKRYEPFGSQIKFQFSEVALLNKCKIPVKSKQKIKQNAIGKLIMSVVKQHNVNIKQQLITIKEQTRSSLESLVQLYNEILSQEQEKVKKYDEEQERQRQIDACSWIYLSHEVIRKSQSFDTMFYRRGKKISKFNKTFNLILKKALQRYQLFAGVSLALLSILYQLPQPPMVYVCRFEYSFNEIKGTAFLLKKQKANQKKEEDIKCTLIIGVCQNKILFSALRKSKITEEQLKKFLILYFSNFHKDKKYNISLYEFQNNRRSNWDYLGKVIFQLKSKLGFNAFILNYPPCFILHLTINACLRYLLKDNSHQIERENFYAMVYTFQKRITTAFRSADTQQILQKYLQFTNFAKRNDCQSI